MANVIKPKRSNTAAKVPNTSELLSGELGVNMADKKVYINNGTSVIQVGAGVLSALGDVAITSPTSGQSLSWNGTAWVNSTGSGSGTVTSVTGTAPVSVATGTTTPVISMAAATASVSGYMTSTYASKLDGIAAGATNVTNTNQLTNGAGFITSSGTSAACSGNAATATTLSGDQSNWASLRTSAVANMLSWKNYGNGHIIFDASASTSPTGSAVNSTNAAVAWTGTYPTLMGWNGSTTYGVRVDSARISDSTSGSSASCTGNAATATLASNTNSVTGALGNSYTWTGVQNFTGNGNTGSAAGIGMAAYSTASNGAIMAFHRAGVYAINMGLDSDNVFRIGGWSAAANRLQMDMSGNLTMAGNVTAYSDERKKKNWRPVAENFVEKLAKVKSGVYERTDEELTQVGVSAQSFQTLLPEAVLTDNDGFLSVAYGNAALTASVELAKELVALKELVKELKAEVDELKNIIVSNNGV